MVWCSERTIELSEAQEGSCHPHPVHSYPDGDSDSGASQGASSHSVFLWSSLLMEHQGGLYISKTECLPCSTVHMKDNQLQTYRILMIAIAEH